MKMSVSWLLLVVCILSLTGCKTPEAERLRAMNRKSQEQIARLEQQLREKDEQIEAMRNAPGKQDPALLEKLNQALADRDRMKVALEDAERRIRDLGKLQAPALPAELDQALVELAASNPELMEYDSKRGMIKFRSDFTFAPGSVEVKAAAAAGLAKLAQIVNMPVAGRYEVRIVGHTDNVPIQRVKAQHPTNWHLSVHRAIAVKDVLEKSGVSPARFNVAGYGEYWPVVPNGAKGAEANRRVEIFLVPGSGSASAGSAPTPLPASAPAPKAAPAAENPAEFK